MRAKTGPSSIIFFGFRIDDSEEIPTVRVIGWEKWARGDKYDWDCRAFQKKRYIPYVFQYTVSGEGELEIDGKTHRLRAGQAFLIEKPGPYRYYLPADSESWELKFIELSHVDPHWHTFIESDGRIIETDQDSEVMQTWEEIYRLADTESFEHTYHNSILAYSFLMRLRSGALRRRNRAVPVAIRNCQEFIEISYAHPIGLEDLSRLAGMSPTHVTRLFRAHLGVTPQQYLTRVRIRHAYRLLASTSLSNEEIAARCGFANGNYFAKVFRKMVNASPQQFRNDSALRQNSSIHFI